MSITSKDISEYSRVDPLFLKPNLKLGFTLFLYFSQNDHIVTWKQKGDALTTENLKNAVSKKLRLWIHNSDQATYEQFCATPPLSQPDQIQPDKRRDRKNQTVSPVSLVRALPTDSQPLKQTVRFIDPKSKTPLEVCLENKATSTVPHKIQEAAQKTLLETASAKSAREQEPLTARATRAVNSVLASPLLGKSSKDSEGALPPHGIVTATYTVLFAMGFGSGDASFLSELAAAGLLHDIGLSQFSHSDIIKNKTEAHIQIGCNIISRSAPWVTRQSIEIIEQHHEKFDGTGFPRRLKGFNIADTAQILSLASTLDFYCRGNFDSKKRTLSEALNLIEQKNISSGPHHPGFFNPALFQKIATWLKLQASPIDLKSAGTVVKNESNRILSVAVGKD